MELLRQETYEGPRKVRTDSRRTKTEIPPHKAAAPCIKSLLL